MGEDVKTNGEASELTEQPTPKPEKKKRKAKLDAVDAAVAAQKCPNCQKSASRCKCRPSEIAMARTSEEQSGRHPMPASVNADDLDESPEPRSTKKRRSKKPEVSTWELRDATPEERKLIDSKGQTCYKIRDYGDKAIACPDKRELNEEFCYGHGGSEPQETPAQKERHEIMKGNGKATKKAKVRAVKAKAAPKERKQRQLMKVALIRKSKWKTITAPQRAAVLAAIDKLGECDSREISQWIEKSATHSKFFPMKDKLMLHVQQTVTSMKRLGFAKDV